MSRTDEKESTGLLNKDYAKSSDSVPEETPSTCVPQVEITDERNTPVGKKSGVSAPKDEKKDKKRKAPENRPKRPLSAYNLFFKYERAKLINDSPPVMGMAGQHSNEHHPPQNHALVQSPRHESGQSGNISSPDPYSRHRQWGGSPRVCDSLYSPERVVQPAFVSSAACAKSKKKKRVHRKTHGKIGFAQLAKHIAHQWKSLDRDSRSHFEHLAELERQRYEKEKLELLSDQNDKEVSINETCNSSLIHTPVSAKSTIAIEAPAVKMEKGPICVTPTYSGEPFFHVPAAYARSNQSTEMFQRPPSMPHFSCEESGSMALEPIRNVLSPPTSQEDIIDSSCAMMLIQELSRGTHPERKPLFPDSAPCCSVGPDISKRDRDVTNFLGSLLPNNQVGSDGSPHRDINTNLVHPSLMHLI